MKKRDVINLIKYHVQHNDSAFREQAYQIALDFDRTGDYNLAEYVTAMLSDANTLVPQMAETPSPPFLQKAEGSRAPLPLPDPLAQDIVGIVNAVGHNVGVNKFLFQGPPGTGKTESVRQIASITSRELYVANLSAVVDSKLGQTAKNIEKLFQSINGFAHPERVLVLFDEIDALALDRINQHDVREMGRATSTFLQKLDTLNNRVALIATTNLYDRLDKALVRRFDAVIDFDRYTRDDLLDIAEAILEGLLARFDSAARDMRLFRRIMALQDPVPYPGDLRNMLRSALAFSSPNDPYEYLRRLYVACSGAPPTDLQVLASQGLTVRQISILSGVSKSTVSRELMGAANA